MDTTLISALVLLINTLFDFYLFILMARFILCWERANYFNPITQFIIKLTEPLVKRVRQVVPTTHSIEFSTLIILLCFDVIRFFALGFILAGGVKNNIGLLVVAVGDVLKVALDTFSFGIILSAVLSWTHPNRAVSIVMLLEQIIAPVMRPVRRVMPLVGGLDLSPIPALLILQLLSMVCVKPLLQYGMLLTFA